MLIKYCVLYVVGYVLGLSSLQVAGGDYDSIYLIENNKIRKDQTHLKYLILRKKILTTLLPYSSYAPDYFLVRLAPGGLRKDCSFVWDLSFSTLFLVVPRLTFEIV